MSWIRRLSLVFAAALSSHVLPAADKPILLVGAAGNPFSFYNAEILRAEGFNAFDTADIATVTATTLSGYDVVVLGQTVLTPAQVTMFTTWVNGGGYLIAMRPDKQLASLFGIADTGTTLSNGYLLVNTSAAPGTGIVGQTIQFHSTADLYLLSGASSVATLYSTRTASTPNPAVTLRTGIGSGGKAAAFMYDLARSVVYTRQGNPAWAGQARVGQGGPIRSSDMFYGNAVFDPQPDWVDLNNVAIPQADEQQRLLANLILHLNQSKKPLPRFWYFPFGKKAAVIMTGDDHAQGATAGRFDDYLAKSPTGCSVASWECIRGTSYIFPFSPLTNAQAAAYNAQGFEVGLHVNTNCASYTLATLQSFFASQLSTFATNYSGVPAPTTNRNHCIAFSDWSSTPVVQLSHGIRLDTNYYYWPPSWVVSTPGFFTGSGMPMRFAQTDGTTIDVYQSTTQMTDESGQAYPATVDGLLDNAIGSAGYYGAFNANMHTDSNTGNSKLWSDQIVSSALSRGVPVITAKQMLQWLDARNGSSFTSTAWSGNTLTFSIAAAGAANGLQAMLPYTSTVGPLSSLTRNGAPISFAVQTIKGIQYAFFFATTGTYQGTYGGAPPPVITAVTATPAATTATITWTTDKASNSRVDYGTSPSTLNQTASNAAMVTGHSVSLTGLTAGTLYYFRVTSVDATNGSTTSPPLTATAATFTTVDSTPPVITVVTVPPGFGGTATITWTTNELSTSRVDYGILSSNLNLNATNASMVTAHSITLTGLTAGTTYYFRVTSVDAGNNSATLPASPNPPSSFVQTQTSTVSIWNVSAVPGLVDSGDPGSVELGMKFRSDLAGTVTGVRFYKAAANTGIHIGNLWSSTGTLLGSVTFTNETASGWQQANFAAPVSIAANTTYIVSYLVPNGHYSADNNFFASTGVDTPPLHALADGVDGLNGVYQYSSTSVFPSQSYQSSNYWVDVVFGDSPPVISAVSAAVGATSATITWTTNEASNSRVDYGTSPASLTTSQTNASMVTAHSIALSGLTTGTTYYYRVRSVDAGGNSTTSPVTTTSPATFVPAALPVITAVTATPAATTATITWATDKSSNSRVDYGTSPSTLNQTASNAAMVTSHSVSLTGLTAGTLYYFRVTSVDATNGSTTSPPLTATAATFMTSDSIPPVITAVTVPPGFGGTAAIIWTTNELSTSRVDYGILSSNLNLNATNASMVTAHSITLTGLTAGTTYYFRVTSVDAGNNSATLPASPNPPSSFAQTSTVSIWNASAVPGLVDSGDPGSVELGMKFRSDLAGTVTGVRFYKAAANTGIHIGNLWSSTGTLLGSVTFTNETASGWQQANFAAPVSIAANTTYIVSYLVPNGHYSADNNFFASTGVDTPPLHALANGVDGSNGVYQYSSTSVFPSQSYQSSNYWVDVVFGDSPPVISAVSAAVGATSATITWTTNEASNSRVDYGTSPASLTTSQTNASMVTAHSIALSGLTTGVTYYYRVTSVDAGGNSTTSPVTTTSPATFVPANAPQPVITAVTVIPGSTSAIITWTTNLASNSRVDYGITPAALNQIATNAAIVTSHSVAISGLTASSTYYYRVTSVTSAGGSAESPTGSPASFVTTAGSGGGNGNPPSEWDITGAGDATIQGFSTDISVNKGDTVSFKINTNATAYTIDVYRMGYYNGNGASKVATISPSAALPQTQPSCLTIPATGLIDCGNWSISASWPVPSTAKSGIYFAKIRRTDTGGASHIIFVVRDDASTSAILFQTSDTTWQAYNQYAGNSLYVGAPAGRAYKVSYNRPITTRSNAPEDFVFNAEYPMVRWLEANGYDVTYTTGVDSDRRGNLIGQHRLFLSVGHDEYWSAAQRANVEAARDSGTNIAFFSGNEVFWKTRWEDNNRTLVCYKETHANAKIDPTGVWTGTWRDPRFSPPADGGRPENRLTGTIFTVNAGPTTLAVQVPADDGKMRFWRNTGLQNQAPGATATLTSGTLGYEWDEDLNNGARPAGLIRLSTTQSSVSQLLLDYGSAYIPGTATHSTTLYRALSGALVFGAGTVQWMWGLDANHDRGNAPADARMQQAIVNLFADMGVQPSTLQSGLIPAAGSNDTTVPASTITSPAAGAVLQSGAAVTITGTATDSGGGVIGGIEVSVDGGLTWNRAVGRESWSYSWTPVSTGSQAIRVRATDDSLNTQSAITTVSVTVNGASGNSIWLPSATPTIPSDSDTAAVELGVKFRSDVAGSVRGVRFYKGSVNTGTHIGKLWTSTGTLLASVTFTNESASGWQQALFTSPVQITANTTYIVSYYAPNGGYAGDTNFFTATGIDSPPLHALRDGVDGPNGLYRYGTGGGFPASSFQSSNYWVDLVFVPQ